MDHLVPPPGSYNKPVDHEPLEVLLAPAAPPPSQDTPACAPQARPHAPFVPVYHNGERASQPAS
jgi:hypothetical protein